MVFKELIYDVIGKLDEIPLSEDDLKFKLACGLKENNKFLKINLEYPVPKSFLKGYDFNNNKFLYFDLLIENDNNFIPLEIKYKTKHIKLSRKVIGTNMSLELKNQYAQNLAKYGFWKDIYRIQALKHNCKSISRGYQVFLTNDCNYKKPTKKNAQVKYFEICDERHITRGTNLFWLENGIKVDDVSNTIHKNKTFYKNRGFKIENNYVLKWDTVKIEDVDFYFLIVEV